MNTRDLHPAAGAAFGGLGVILVALLLVPLRSDIDNSVVLLLVVPVLLGAITGGTVGGAAAALVATFSFDFFFTLPYRSLHIESANDVETALALLVVALIVGTIAGRARRAAAEALAGREDVESMHRVAALVARRADQGQVIDRARAELQHLLSLDACEFVPSPATDAIAPSALPQVAHSGRIETNYLRYLEGGFELPVGAQLLAHGPRGNEGRFVLHGRPGTPVSLQRRLAAVVIADLVGARLGATGGTGGPGMDPDERGADE
jgi:hypothetical protein